VTEGSGDGTKFLTLDDLLQIADRAVGGQALVRDIGLLDAAAARSRASAFGADAYPTLTGKAAALVESLVRNHALVDGNKGIGWLATYVFLGLNGVVLQADDDEAYDLVIAIAEGRLGADEVAAVLHRWTGA
jgi:death on curing protein